jgi:hypothetical protein
VRSSPPVRLRNDTGAVRRYGATEHVEQAAQDDPLHGQHEHKGQEENEPRYRERSCCRRKNESCDCRVLETHGDARAHCKNGTDAPRDSRSTVDQKERRHNTGDESEQSQEVLEQIRGEQHQEHEWGRIEAVPHLRFLPADARPGRDVDLTTGHENRRDHEQRRRPQYQKDRDDKTQPRTDVSIRVAVILRKDDPGQNFLEGVQRGRKCPDGRQNQDHDPIDTEWDDEGRDVALVDVPTDGDRPGELRCGGHRVGCTHLGTGLTVLGRRPHRVRRGFPGGPAPVGGCRRLRGRR